MTAPGSCDGKELGEGEGASARASADQPLTASNPSVGGGCGLEEQARVDEVPVEPDGPVEMGAGRVAGVALVPDDLAGMDDRAGGNRAVWLHVGVPRVEVRS